MRVQVFDKDGIFVRQYGITREPYIVDTNHYNAPGGLAVDNDGNMYILETRGFRLIKLDKAGNQVWTVGQAGIYGDDNQHFGTYWGYPDGSPAVDQYGKV
jgi:sugar lactone lactonase YvrE